MRLIFLVYTFFIFFVSCKFESKVTFLKVYDYDFPISKHSKWELRKTDTLYHVEESNMHFYKKNQEPYLKVYREKNVLLYNDFDETFECDFIEYKEYIVDKTRTKVFKFFLNNENLIDEESIIYYTDKHGIVASKPIWWNSVALFCTRNNKRLLDVMIEDTLTFKSPEKLQPPPPPPPNSGAWGRIDTTKDYYDSLISLLREKTRKREDYSLDSIIDEFERDFSD